MNVDPARPLEVSPAQRERWAKVAEIAKGTGFAPDQIAALCRDHATLSQRVAALMADLDQERAVLHKYIYDAQRDARQLQQQIETAEALVTALKQELDAFR